MATKHISDLQVCRAINLARLNGNLADTYLSEWTGEPAKVIHCALSRAHGRGLIDYGISLRAGWLTGKGVEFLMKRAGE